MCGVSGVYGAYAPIKSMLMTLSMLERGVEGCGVAYMCKDNMVVLKQPVSPIEFFNDNLYRLNVDSWLAISHNRQPSIGKVCFENTHPFISCDSYFALIHNGTAVNHGLRERLLAEGHKIKGETDSEVLAHALEDLFNETGNMVKALKELAELYLSGAVLVLTSDNEIYACKTCGYPLHYAEVNGEVYIASTEKAVKRLLKALNAEDVEVNMLDDSYILAVKGGKTKLYKCLSRKNWYWFEYDSWSLDY
ncbi:MAG: class II glutamine amidotransferase [Candidatus Bathyarchaeia archaeon]